MMIYSREELLRLEIEGQRDDMMMLMGTAVFQELCRPIRHRHRNINKRKRKRRLQINHPKLLDSEICSFNESVNGDCQDLIEEDDSFADSDDEVSVQRLAFLVEGEPDFESGPPQDGFEYLRRVMWEAAQCPKVKIAKIGKKKLMSQQTAYMPEIPPIPICLPNLLPSRDWVEEFLKDFSDLRSDVSKCSVSMHEGGVNCLPSIRDQSGWKSLCFGQRRSTNSQPEELEDTNVFASPRTTFPKESVCDDVAQYCPYLKVVLRLDESSRATLFRYHVSWIKGHGHLAYDRAMWLFALAAVVDCPLDDQTCAAFRDLLRKCAELRVEKSIVDEELYMLNILMTIAGEYFGQAENCGMNCA